MTNDHILQVRGVSRSFDGIRAVNEASFEVERGSITGLIGPNGAGKTTMFNLISGFLRPDRGTIFLDGQRIDGRPGHVIARAGLVRTFQIPRVLTRLTVLENMMLAAKHQLGETFGAALLMPGRVAKREQHVRDQAMRLLDLIRLTRLANDYAGTLSGGQRKLLEFGRALMTEPWMVLLDEPMAGVNPALALQLLEHILELRASEGTTFCVIEHDMEAVMAISDRIVVMDEGTVIAAGLPEEIQKNERVIDAYLGRSGEEPEPGTRLQVES